MLPVGCHLTGEKNGQINGKRSSIAVRGVEEIKRKAMVKEIRLILGDQLNEKHSWFSEVNEQVLYVLMEIRTESEYVKHHVQKIVGIFSAMRLFAQRLRDLGHQVKYYKIGDKDNHHSFEGNITELIENHKATHFSYQLPDEYRLDQLLNQLISKLAVESKAVDTEHFLTSRSDLAQMFEGKKSYLMETFYRNIRKKYHVLMEGDKPITGKWNYDHENRKKLPRNHQPTLPKFEVHDVKHVYDEVVEADLPYIGRINASQFIWTLTRVEAMELFDYFLHNLLPLFGTFQDAMSQHHWSLYHSRISFAMNIKLIHPEEIVRKAEQHWLEHQEEISIAQVEGFIRQILGWREYMRGVYWAKMPDYAQLNYFEHNRKLPSWFWTGETKMNCLSKTITQSLDHAYAHHIQRLMVTGNFALLAGIDPDEVDAWYLGIYIDAFEWVEITNTRGMSQYADGGIVGTKPYVSSASYMHKMGDYCTHCSYKQKEKLGDNACPFNSLYWDFIDRNRATLASNPRMSMMYRVWDKYDGSTQQKILEQAGKYLEGVESL